MKPTVYVLIILGVIFLIGLCAWAPWLGSNGGERASRIVIHNFNDREIRKQVVDNNGQLLCDGLYSTWVPCGRWVSNCENAWLVAFWGQVFEKSPPAYEARMRNTVRESVSIGYTGCS